MDFKEAYVLSGCQKAAEKTKIYFWHFNELLKGFLPGVESSEDLISLYRGIKPCTCGEEAPRCLETETMGDSDFTITCEKCGRSITRNIYDMDLIYSKDNNDYIHACVEDWNAGKTQDDIVRMNEKRKNNLQIKESDIKWLPLYPNNMSQNPQCGWYCLLFKKDEDGGISGIKWTITFQKEESAPMVIRENAKTEAYNLFEQIFYDVKGPLCYKNPEKCDSYFDNTDDSTLGKCGVNNYGDFVRSYKSLELAKEGAIARCFSRGINTDTILKVFSDNIDKKE